MQKLSGTQDVDPRVKILFLIVVMILIFLSRSLDQLFLLEFLILLVIFDHGLLKKWLKFTVSVIFFLIIIIGINYLIVSPGNVSAAIEAGFRILCFFSLMFWFSSSVQPDHLAQALTSLKLPYSLSWQLATAYRFIPLFETETKRVVEAQLSRGIPLDKGIFPRIKGSINLVIPLLANTLIKSDQLAEALVTRSWDPRKKRTNLYPLKMHSYDYFILTIITFFGCLGVWLLLG